MSFYDYNTAVTDQIWNEVLPIQGKDSAVTRDVCFGDELNLNDTATASLDNISMLNDSNFESSTSCEMTSPIKPNISGQMPADWSCGSTGSHLLAATGSYHSTQPPASRDQLSSSQSSSSWLSPHSGHNVSIDDGYSSWSECTPSIKDIIDPELYRCILDTIIFQDEDPTCLNPQSSEAVGGYTTASSGSTTMDQMISPLMRQSPEHQVSTSPISVSSRSPPGSVRSVDSEDGIDVSGDAHAKKPNESYMIIIAKVMISSPTTQMLLCDIYKAIMERHPYFQNNNSSWRSSIRHNLSSNHCFVRMPTRTGNKACWAIRPEYVQPFRLGDFGSKKMIRKLKTQQTASVNTQSMYCEASHYPMAQNPPMMNQQYNGYSQNYMGMGSVVQYTTDQYGQQVYMVV